MTEFVADYAKSRVKSGRTVARGAARASSATVPSGQKPDYRARHSTEYQGKHRAPGAGRSPAKPSKSSTGSEHKRTGKSAPGRVAAVGKKAAATRTQSALTTSRAIQGAKRRDLTSRVLALRPKTRMLAAEYMAAIVMAIILLFMPDQTYHQKMSRFFIQMTGISGIFFVLALASSSERTAKFAIPFGLLVDLSMLVYLFNKGGGAYITSVLGGKASTTTGSTAGQGTMRPISDVQKKYAVPHNAPSSELIPGTGFTFGPSEAVSSSGGSVTA